MFSNTIKQVPVDEIVIDRSARQRSELTFDSVLELAAAIGGSQWISPILVDEETNKIVAGERRLTAVKALQAATNGDYSGFSNEAAARETLHNKTVCDVKSWEHWTKIPVQFGRALTAQDIAVYEFIENAHREDLSWQDRAHAVYTIHAHGLRSTLNSKTEWTATHTANIVGLSRTHVFENLNIWRYHECEDPKLKDIINESPSLKAARQNLTRYTSRREAGQGVSLSSGHVYIPEPSDPPKSLNKKPGPAPLTDVNIASPEEIDWSEEEDEPTSVALADRYLHNADFTQWAEDYSGPPFNFLHCDFPYGINFNAGDQAKTVANSILGEYEDSSEVYWNLLNTLKTHKEKLLDYQAHIMFWFSQNLRRETEDFFTQMGGVVQPFLMIWHCSDQDGLLPDPQRYGRRTYETAMLVTFGDRKIVAPRSLSVSAQRGSRSRIHRSQKPLQVLEHFFEMFVDDASTVLDPTVGSGTSVLAAHYRKAARVVALELDPSTYKTAYNFINSSETGLAL